MNFLRPSPFFVDQNTGKKVGDQTIDLNSAEEGTNFYQTPNGWATDNNGVYVVHDDRQTAHIIQLRYMKTPSGGGGGYAHTISGYKDTEFGSISNWAVQQGLQSLFTDAELKKGVLINITSDEKGYELGGKWYSHRGIGYFDYRYDDSGVKTTVHISDSGWKGDLAKAINSSWLKNVRVEWDHSYNGYLDDGVHVPGDHELQPYYLKLADNGTYITNTHFTDNYHSYDKSTNTITVPVHQSSSLKFIDSSNNVVSADTPSHTLTVSVLKPYDTQATAVDFIDTDVDIQNKHPMFPSTIFATIPHPSTLLFPSFCHTIYFS